MPTHKPPEDPIDWNLTTWEGSRREALRRWAALPLERIIAALEEMQELNATLASPSGDSTLDAGDSHAIHEPSADYGGMADTAHALPAYTDADLAGRDAPALIALLREHEDRVPRNLVDACADRGDAMVQALAHVADFPDFWDGDVDTGTWWLRLHSAMVLGLIATEYAGQRLVDLMRRLDAIDDQDMQDWLAGYWPALFANKPAVVGDVLRALAEDRKSGAYIRANAAEAVVRLAYQSEPSQLEAALDWLSDRVGDEHEDWDTRLSFCYTLLDFPRDRYRPRLERLAALQTGLGKAFDVKDIERASAKGRDHPGWERFDDPWNFYAADAIAARQRRWAEEDRQQLERGRYADDDSAWHEPYVRPEPKIGRNDPCLCGSGKKYKKCCLDKTR